MTRPLDPIADAVAARLWGYIEAVALAEAVHGEQVDKGGRPYIDHVWRVANAVPSWCKAAAMLHDVVEDGEGMTIEWLSERFAPDVVAAVDALTRREGEVYADYIERVALNPIARIVKLADLADNMDDERQAAAVANGCDVSGLRDRYRRAVTRLAPWEGHDA